MSGNKRKNAVLKERKNAKKQKATLPQPKQVVVIDSDDEEHCNSPSSAFPSSDSNSPLFEFEKIQVTQKDRDSLQSSKSWMNDNLVDFFLNIENKSSDQKSVTYLFNSMFFMKLKQIESSENQDYYGETLSWFKNGEANSKRIWFIPVCEQQHWYTIAVHHPISNQPTIFVFDSLSERRRQDYKAVDLIKAFLLMKFKAERTGKFRRFKLTRGTVPQQKNLNDCGLHVLRMGNILLNLQEEYLKLAEGRGDHAETAIDQIYRQHKVPTRRKIRKAIDVFAGAEM